MIDVGITVTVIDKMNGITGAKHESCAAVAVAVEKEGKGSTEVIDEFY